MRPIELKASVKLYIGDTIYYLKDNKLQEGKRISVNISLKKMVMIYVMN
jgi:hypothetical protein